MSNLNRPPDYKILSWNEAFEMVYENGIEFHRPSSILEIENIVHIYLYHFASTKTIVLPQYPVEEFSRNEYPAFLYQNDTGLKAAIELKQFPVPDTFITLLEKEKESLKRIEETYQDYLSFFDSIMKTSFADSISIDNLSLVHSRLASKKKDSQFGKLLLAYSILINRFLMQERNAYSSLIIKNQGYFPFYVPCVRIGESTVNSYESIGWKELKGTFESCLTRILLSARPLLPEFKFDDTMDYLKYLFSKGMYK